MMDDDWMLLDNCCVCVPARCWCEMFASVVNIYCPAMVDCCIVFVIFIAAAVEVEVVVVVGGGCCGGDGYFP